MSESPKYLEKVETVSSEAMVYVEHIYCSTRDLQRKYSPTFVENLVARLESTLQPYYAKAQNVSKSALLMADGTVEQGVQLASGTFARTETTAKSVFGEDRVKTVKDTVSGTLTSLRQEGVYKTISNLCGAARGQASEAGDKAKNAGKAVLEKPQVKSFVDQAERYYSALHERVVSDRLYAALYNLTVASWRYVSYLPVVAVPVGTVTGFTYPFVKPIVDPAIDATAPYVDALAKHIAPTAESERAAPNSQEDHPADAASAAYEEATKEAPVYEKSME